MDEHIRQIFFWRQFLNSRSDKVDQTDKVVKNGSIQKQQLSTGNMQHFWGQNLESRLEGMLSGEYNSNLSVPHDKFSVQDAL